MHLLEPDRNAGCLKLGFAEKNERRRKGSFHRVCGASGAGESVAGFFVLFRFFRLPALIGERTRRSNERAPASTPIGDADVAGGWLPSLTLAFDNPEANYARREHHRLPLTG